MLKLQWLHDLLTVTHATLPNGPSPLLNSCWEFSEDFTCVHKPGWKPHHRREAPGLSFLLVSAYRVSCHVWHAPREGPNAWPAWPEVLLPSVSPSCLVLWRELKDGLLLCCANWVSRHLCLDLDPFVD